MNPKVSIIILNYNWKRFLLECLNSVINQSYQDFEIVFVDNNSGDWSVDFVKENFRNEILKRKLIIIRNNKNDGFAEWNNIWVRNCNATNYIWLLNNDTIIDKDALKYLIKSIEFDNKIWAVGSLVLDKWQEEITKKVFLDYKLKWISTYFWESAILRQDKNDNELVYTSLLWWCSLLYRSDIIKEPFPEFYFAYAEDVWLSWFILMKGYKLAVCTKSVVNHFWWSTKKYNKNINKLAVFHWTKNQIINFLVFYNFITIIKLLPLFLITQFWHIVFSNFFERIYIKLKSNFWILINMNKILKLRSFIQKERVINDKVFLSQLSYKIRDYWEWENLSYTIKKLTDFMNWFFKLYKKIFYIPSLDN